MGKVIPFKKPSAKPQGLCQHGFHHWVIDTDKQFDVKRGKLVTRYVCQRCGKHRVKGQ